MCVCVCGGGGGGGGVSYSGTEYLVAISSLTGTGSLWGMGIYMYTPPQEYINQLHTHICTLYHLCAHVYTKQSKAKQMEALKADS